MCSKVAAMWEARMKAAEASAEDRAKAAEQVPPRPPLQPPLTPSSALHTVPRAGFGLVQGTRTLHTELAPGNP
eukprot:5160335-Pyramimonas_sp.AAC.1